MSERVRGFGPMVLGVSLAALVAGGAWAESEPVMDPPALEVIELEDEAQMEIALCDAACHAEFGGDEGWTDGEWSEEDWTDEEWTEEEWVYDGEEVYDDEGNVIEVMPGIVDDCGECVYTTTDLSGPTRESGLVPQEPRERERAHRTRTQPGLVTDVDPSLCQSPRSQFEAFLCGAPWPAVR